MLAEPDMREIQMRMGVYGLVAAALEPLGQGGRVGGVEELFEEGRRVGLRQGGDGGWGWVGLLDRRVGDEDGDGDGNGEVVEGDDVRRQIDEAPRIDVDIGESTATADMAVDVRENGEVRDLMPASGIGGSEIAGQRVTGVERDEGLEEMRALWHSWYG